MEHAIVQQTRFSEVAIPEKISRANEMSKTKTKRDTKTMGDISELRVMTKLIELGYRVALPYGENHRYDIVADDGEKLFRVQVKTGKLRNGVIRYACSTSHYHRGESSRPYFGQIDLLGVFCPGTDAVYLLPADELTATVAHLRVDPTKNGMKKTIRWAHQFELK